MTAVYKFWEKFFCELEENVLTKLKIRDIMYMSVREKRLYGGDVASKKVKPLVATF